MEKKRPLIARNIADIESKRPLQGTLVIRVVRTSRAESAQRPIQQMGHDQETTTNESNQNLPAMRGQKQWCICSC